MGGFGGSVEVYSPVLHWAAPPDGGMVEGGRGRRDAGGNLRLHTQRNKGKLEGGGWGGGLGGSASVLQSSAVFDTCRCNQCAGKQKPHWKTTGGSEGETFSGRWPRRNFAIRAVRGPFEVLSFVIISAPSVGRSKSSSEGRADRPRGARTRAFASDVTVIDGDWSGSRHPTPPPLCFANVFSATSCPVSPPPPPPPSHLLWPRTQFSRKLTRRRRQKLKFGIRRWPR